MPFIKLFWKVTVGTQECLCRCTNWNWKAVKCKCQNLGFSPLCYLAGRPSCIGAGCAQTQTPRLLIVTHSFGFAETPDKYFSLQPSHIFDIWFFHMGEMSYLWKPKFWSNISDSRWTHSFNAFFQMVRMAIGQLTPQWFNHQSLLGDIIVATFVVNPSFSQIHKWPFSKKNECNWQVTIACSGLTTAHEWLFSSSSLQSSEHVIRTRWLIERHQMTTIQCNILSKIYHQPPGDHHLFFY